MESNQKQFGKGFLSGIVLTTGVAVAAFLPSPLDYTMTYEHQGRKVIATYNAGVRINRIFVQGTNEGDIYLPLKRYLESFTNKNDRALEKARIEEIVKK